LCPGLLSFLDAGQSGPIGLCSHPKGVRVKTENHGEIFAPDASTAEADAAGEISETEEKMGTFTFVIEEKKNVFGHLPAEKNMANSFSTMLLAKPEAGSSEEFSIVVMNFNVKTEDNDKPPVPLTDASFEVGL
jgi:hypothetical protein